MPPRLLCDGHAEVAAGHFVGHVQLQDVDQGGADVAQAVVGAEGDFVGFFAVIAM
jgi:hypothetical protein